MKRYLYALAALLIFAAGAASASVVITLTSLSKVEVCLEPIGNAACPNNADCPLMITVKGTTVDSTTLDRERVVKQFRADDPVYTASPYLINTVAAANLFIKSRRALKVEAINEDSD